MDPNQDSPDLDPTAVAGQPAAEMHEGAPAFSDAPDLDAAPDQGAEPEIDWKAKYEADQAQWQQETAAERQRREALEVQQQQLLAQAGQAAWDKEAQDARAYANTLDTDSAFEYMDKFRANREARIMDQAQKTTQAFAINQFVDQVVSYWGLKPTDRLRLGSDPNQMNAIAEAIVADRADTSSEIATLRKELQQEKRARQAREALANPAYRQGGTRPNGAPAGSADPNSLDPWVARLTGMVPEPRR